MVKSDVTRELFDNKYHHAQRHLSAQFSLQWATRVSGLRHVLEGLVLRNFFDMKITKRKDAAAAQKSKKKRWKKGHSSDSNPEAKKHRLAAKNRFFNHVEGLQS